MEASHVVFRVRDEGKGMSEASLKKATEPFHTDKAQASGLGLRHRVSGGMMPHPKKALLVDDEPGVLLGLMRTLLKDNEHYDVPVATSGESAQQILSEQHIHVLLTDISMPGMSGIDLLLWVAQECPDTQVGVITATDVDQIGGQAYRPSPGRSGCGRFVRSYQLGREQLPAGGADSIPPGAPNCRLVAKMAGRFAGRRR